MVSFRLCLLAALMVLAGCSNAPSPGMRLVPGAVVSKSVVTLTAQQIAQVMSTGGNRAYRLGPTDVISLNVYLQPELDVPVPGLAAGLGGVMITSDGNVQLPLIGEVHLGGLTLREARRLITDDYAGYINNPKVAVELVQAQSMRYYLLGAFTTPGIKYPARKLSLLEALALGGSVDIPNADLYQAYVAHGSVKLPVDLHSLLIEGDLSQNVELASGDAIVIPNSNAENAFVFGAVGKPGAIQFQSGRLTLLQALSVAGLDLNSYADARLSDIHLIRPRGRSAAFFVINANAIIDGEAPPFDLEPGDIIYVPPTGLATWASVLKNLTPSLQVVSSALNPFVQIKFLRQ